MHHTENQGARQKTLATISKDEIMNLIPHRDQALCIDTAIFNPNTEELIVELSPEENYFIGHFPGNPVLPGHWQYEAMCLASAVLFRQLHPNIVGDPALIGTDGRLRFQRPIFPGEKINIHALKIGENKIRNALQIYFSAKITLNGKTMAFAEKLIGTFFPK